MSRTLIVAPNWIGDAVMSLPLLDILQEKGWTIDVLATPWVKPVYQSSLAVCDVLDANLVHGQMQLYTRWSLAKIIKLRNYDQCVILPNSFKSALIPWLANIPERIAYVGELRSPLLTATLPNPPKKNRPAMVEHYAQLANLSPTPRGSIKVDLEKVQLLPKLYVQPERQLQARQFLEKLWLKQNITAPKVHILAPGAEFGDAKQWPIAHFARLATLLLKSDPAHVVVIIGSNKDREIGAEIQALIPHHLRKRSYQLCGTITLESAIAIISTATSLASNDSGIMHIGAALGMSQIALFGSSDPKHTPPLSPFAKILYLGLDCSPCHQRKCPLGHLNCLRQITPDIAFEAILDAISQRNLNAPPSTPVS